MIFDINVLYFFYNQYANNNYKYIDTPWLVSLESINLTLPKDKKVFPVLNSYLVGSAEQGFIELLKTNHLTDDKYMSFSPCFRDEGVYDDLHKPYFSKLEIFKITNKYSILLNDALKSINNYISHRGLEKYNSVSIDNTEQGMDILLNDIEIGSYGNRNINIQNSDVTYSYGTGVAMPRFLQTLKKTY